MKRLGLFVLLGHLSGAAVAAPETYTIDANHTFARFSYSHFGFSTQQSRFDQTSGNIVLDRQAHNGSVHIEIDTRSVATGNPQFNEHIQGPEFLDTAHFGKAVFQSSSVHFDGERVIAVDGELTLKGIRKPVTLTVTSFQCMPHPMLQKDACGANATAVIKRSDFDMGKYAPQVSDEVTLSIAVEAIKQ